MVACGGLWTGVVGDLDKTDSLTVFDIICMVSAEHVFASQSLIVPTRSSEFLSDLDSDVETLKPFLDILPSLAVVSRMHGGSLSVLTCSTLYCGQLTATSTCSVGCMSVAFSMMTILATKPDEYHPPF